MVQPVCREKVRDWRDVNQIEFNG